MQPLSPSRPGTCQLLGIADAARVLGLSETTVRRMVKSGRLEAERVERPQGHVWLVRVPSPAVDQVTGCHDLGAAADGHAAGQPARAAWMTSVLEPLVAELRLSRERIEVLADERARFRAERDAARGELDAARARISTLEARTAPQSAEPAPGPFSGRLHEWVAAAVAVLAIVAVAVLPAWSW